MELSNAREGGSDHLDLVDLVDDLGIRELRRRVVPNHFWTVERLCEHLIACDKGQVDTGGIHPVTVSRREYWSELERSRLVVLDELGTRTNVTDHHAEVVKRVLDIREGRPLVIISNLRASELESVYGDRIASRAAAGTIIDWSHYADRRLEHHMAKAAD